MTIERWERPWPTTNCAYNINLRNSQAKFNRERIRVQKDSKAHERLYRQNVRKLNAAQRGVISMLGRGPYANCDRDQVLFEYNQPGFCYRKDGEPRKFCSLLESKTRKIVHDLEGKEGLFKKPASNIISDSPLMAEILSSPSIIEILCDLRTTAVLISDPDLFAQFAKSLMTSPDNPLPFHGENPMDCLVHYRINLIHEFFDALRIQMEIRRPPPSMDTNRSVPALNYLNLKSGNDSSVATATPLRPFASLTMSSKDWNEAVMQRLLATKLEQDQKKGQLEKEGRNAEDRENFLDAYLMQVNTKDDLTLSPSNAFNLLSPSTLIPPVNTAEMVTAVDTTVNLNLVSSVPTVDKFTSTLWPHPLPPAQKPKRHEFDRFVKNLVMEVEKIAEIGKNMGQLQKRKQQFDTVTNPLVRLLRKESLFSSLTEDDLLFYEYEGGRRDAERRIARSLNMSQPRPGGFTFRVPSRSDEMPPRRSSMMMMMMNGDNDILMESMSRRASARSRSRPTTSIDQNRRQSLLLCPDDSEKGSCQRSLKRLCCPACNAKLRSKCNEAQERDRRDKMNSENSQWNMAGMSREWTKNSSKDSKAHHLLSSVPLALSRNYSRYSAKNFAPQKTSSPSSGYGSPFSQFIQSPNSPNNGRYRGQGAPSPAGPRKQFLSQVTKLMSKFKNLSHGGIAGGNRGNSNMVVQKNLQNGDDPPTSSTLKSKILTTQKRKNLANSKIKEDDDKRDNPQFDSWTLKVDRMDMTRLRHELETESMKEKMSHFEKAFLDSLPITSPYYP